MNKNSPVESFFELEESIKFEFLKLFIALYMAD